MGTKVTVESHKGWLRLRWSYGGKRPTLALGWRAEAKVAWTMAEKKAREIEGDIITGNYDVSLNKYKPLKALLTPDDISIVEMVQRFSETKSHLAATTQTKYKALKVKAQKHWGDKGAGISEDEAKGFKRWLESIGLSPVMVLQHIGLIQAAWVWGIKHNLVTENPWVSVLKTISVAPKQQPKPFTYQEIQAISKGFSSNPNHAHYSDFVAFLFGTGCRTGEAIGLRWSHLSEDCGKVWIGESVTRGVRKSTKTNRDREFKLSQPITAMLLKRRPENCRPDDLVFSSPKGSAIDDHNFCMRAWKRVLNTAGVAYRKPYNTRHTFISHALAQNQNPMTIAQMTGHDPEVLFAHYAADIAGGLQCPDIFAESQQENRDFLAS